MKKPLLNIKLFNSSSFGWDALTTFIFSNSILLFTSGVFFVWLLYKTIILAIKSNTQLSTTAPETTAAIHSLLIAGLCLQNNQLTDEYKVRLQRIINLLSEIDYNPKIIILGGLTGSNTLSEARAGAQYLIAHGVNKEQIILEDQSRHTLENLQNARAILKNGPTDKAISSRKIAIISSRYHLYRIVTLAKGLNMTLQPVAAEKNISFSLKTLLRLLKEAYFLHWYWCGKLWVLITANQKSKARIS